MGKRNRGCDISRCQVSLQSGMIQPRVLPAAAFHFDSEGKSAACIEDHCRIKTAFTL